MTVTTQKPLHQHTKICAQCSESFTSKRTDAKHCSNACRKALSRENKIKSNSLTLCVGHLHHKCPDSKHTSSKEGRCPDCKRIHNHFRRYPNSKVGFEVVRLIKRAGSLQTFETLEDLIYFERLIKLRSGYTKISGGKVKNDYDICHKLPLVHPEFIGLTSKANLFIGSSLLNQKAQNANSYCPDWEGEEFFHLIHPFELDPRFKVDVNQSQKAIMNLMLKYFGSDFLDHVVAAAYQPCNTRAKIPKTYERHAEDLPTVLAQSLRNHFGEEGSEITERLLRWARAESDYSVHKGCPYYDPEPWHAIQNYLQTNDESVCAGFDVSYDPKTARPAYDKVQPEE